MASKVYSYSSIKMYKTCPKKYFHLYEVKDTKDTNSFEADFGSMAHKRLEEYVRGVPEDQITKPTVALEDLKFCTQVVDTIRAKSDQVAAELKIGISHALHPVAFFDKAVWLRGVIDMLAIRKDRAWVGDWKFGKVRPDNAQLDMFALQTFINFPAIQTVKAGFIWAKKGRIDPEDFKYYERSDMTTLVDAIRADIAMIESSQQHANWPMQPSGLCGYCAVSKARCIYGRPAAVGEPEEVVAC